MSSSFMDDAVSKLVERQVDDEDEQGKVAGTRNTDALGLPSGAARPVKRFLRYGGYDPALHHTFTGVKRNRW